MAKKTLADEIAMAFHKNTIWSDYTDCQAWEAKEKKDGKD